MNCVLSKAANISLLNDHSFHLPFRLLTAGENQLWWASFFSKIRLIVFWKIRPNISKTIINVLKINIFCIFLHVFPEKRCGFWIFEQVFSGAVTRLFLFPLQFSHKSLFMHFLARQQMSQLAWMTCGCSANHNFLELYQVLGSSLSHPKAFFWISAFRYEYPR